MADYLLDEEDSFYRSSDTSKLNFGHRNRFTDDIDDFEIDFKNNDDDIDESKNLDESMTITILADNITQLRHESDIKQVSLNTRVNQIIKDHLDWHSYATQAKMSYLPKSLITKAINLLTEQELFEFAQSVGDDLQDMCLLLHGEFNLSSFLHILNIWLRITRTPTRFEHDENKYKIIIRHDMGYKYSYLIKEIFRHVIEERFHEPFHYTITENTLLITNERPVQGLIYKGVIRNTYSISSFFV